MTDIWPPTNNIDAHEQALGQARMWRNLALQCRALADQRMATEAEAIAIAYERRAEKLKPVAVHDQCAA